MRTNAHSERIRVETKGTREVTSNRTRSCREKIFRRGMRNMIIKEKVRGGSRTSMKN